MGKTTVFHQGRIFDGERVLPANSVLVEEGTITAVGSHLALPPEATLVISRSCTMTAKIVVDPSRT